MSTELEQVAALVEAESGMVIRDSQMPALAAAVGRVAAGMTPAALLTAAAKPESRVAIVERLIDEVTVKETFFMRHRDELDVLDWRGRSTTALAQGRPTVRVWSAACSSGEEPYTLALLALEAFAPARPPVDILATDIAHSALDRARAGRYGLRSVRHVTEPQRARWFAPHARGLEIGPEARALVRFAHHNLLRDPVPPPGESPFDLIVCRNVLIYFAPEVVRDVILRLQAALAPGGTLILGAADRLGGGPDAVPPARRRPATAPPRPARPRPPRERRRAAPLPATAAAPELDAEAEFERGLAALAAGDAQSAADALRRVLYLSPSHAPAAFQLARAHEARGDAAAARRTYWQLLALLEDADDEVGGVARRDLEAAARERLAALRQH